MKTITYKWKLLIATFSLIFYSSMSLGQVDLIASVNDANPPLSNGQNFTYELVAVASSNYRGVQVTLDYDPSLIQAVSLTPVYNFQVELANNIDNGNGVIEYAGGDFSGNISGTETIFTIVFNVIDNSSTISIMHDFSGALGTAVTNAAGQNVLGATNSIVFETLNISNEDFKSNISIYPNPVKGNLNITTNHTSEINEIRLYTIDGKLVFIDKDIKMTNNHLNIDTLSTLTNGLYLMTLTSVSGEKATYKVVIDH
ncbi:T9SS type A sorting domain-containing protein [Xanthomarina spongicola]|uniref:Putative secreted protein (Por secretion system target) n=1 Tax=Xanthomarina spongicola TaxID=570520 RepID=A0A316DM79_9FLAO|nr:T9SS type A sorting domain-containing protein [Xanthomarina spongicola]PWK18652.1 putative secreted protein (Por secretion system target) [Xanthomarina spongicola]